MRRASTRPSRTCPRWIAPLATAHPPPAGGARPPRGGGGGGRPAGGGGRRGVLRGARVGRSLHHSNTSPPSTQAGAVSGRGVRPARLVSTRRAHLQLTSSAAKPHHTAVQPYSRTEIVRNWRYRHVFREALQPSSSAKQSTTLYNILPQSTTPHHTT